MSLTWIAEKLQMRSAANASQQIRRQRLATAPKRHEARILSQELPLDPYRPLTPYRPSAISDSLVLSLTGSRTPSTNFYPLTLAECQKGMAGRQEVPKASCDQR